MQKLVDSVNLAAIDPAGAVLRPASATPCDDKPVLVDREADYGIPQRVWSNFIPEAGKRRIVRALAPTERTRLQQRSFHLSVRLLPFGGDQRQSVDDSITALMTGFRSMRHIEDMDVDTMVHVTMVVLRDFPAWAIREGCRRVAMNEAGNDPRWPPNDQEIHKIVSEVARPYREALTKVDALLAALVEPPSVAWSGPSREDMEAHRREAERKLREREEAEHGETWGVDVAALPSLAEIRAKIG